MITFSLTPSQEEKLKNWQEEVLKDIKQDKLGVKEVFMFIPCTVGIAVKVVCGEHQLDLTEYENLGNK